MRVMTCGACTVALIAAALALCACEINAFDPQKQDPKKADDAMPADTEEPDAAGVDDSPADAATDGSDSSEASDASDVSDVSDVSDMSDASDSSDLSDSSDVSDSSEASDPPLPGCTDPDALNYDPAANVDDGSCLYPVTVTFNLDMKCATDVTVPQVAGGNTFGMPGDHPMSDPDKDGIWTVSIDLTPGLGTSYTFTSGPCADWSCKEQIAGQPCATAPYDDRYLVVGFEDMTVNACFGKCGDGFCTEC